MNKSEKLKILDNYKKYIKRKKETNDYLTVETNLNEDEQLIFAIAILEKELIRGWND